MTVTAPEDWLSFVSSGCFLLCASHWEEDGRRTLAPPVVSSRVIGATFHCHSKSRKRPASIPTWPSGDCQKLEFFLFLCWLIFMIFMIIDGLTVCSLNLHSCCQFVSRSMQFLVVLFSPRLLFHSSDPEMWRHNYWNKVFNLSGLQRSYVGSLSASCLI